MSASGPERVRVSLPTWVVEVVDYIARYRGTNRAQVIAAWAYESGTTSFAPGVLDVLAREFPGRWPPDEYEAQERRNEQLRRRHERDRRRPT